MATPPETPTSRPASTQGVPRLPSLRVIAALAAAMLAIGVAVGAAIGPAPSASFAGERIPLLLPSIVALATTGTGGHASKTTAAPPPITPQATTAAPTTGTPGAAASTRAATRTAKSKTRSGAGVSPTSTTSPSAPSPTTRTPGKGEGKQVTLPPVTHVWLIELTGATFTLALAQPAAAPYIDNQLVPAGALLSGWSSLQGSALASEAGLLGGEPPQTLDTIVQPPCPASSPEGEGAAGTACAPETAGALSAADDFLKATVGSITSSVAYREHGLVVIVFGTIGNATASSLPAGASTATLSSEPPGGVLLLSPFARAGSRPAAVFNPTSPKQSLSWLLR